MSTSSPSSFISAVQNRRTIYQLSKESTVPDKDIIELTKQTILHTPSAFNVQAGRAVVLLHGEHEKFWDLTAEIVKPIFGPGWASMEPRINGYRGAYGTVLFFEDNTALTAMGQKFPMAADLLPQWSEHSDGMAQFALWTALASVGLGANLQHFGTLVQARVAQEWGLPTEWDLKAQLVFGKPVGGPMEKTFEPIEERVLVPGV